MNRIPLINSGLSRRLNRPTLFFKRYLGQIPININNSLCNKISFTKELVLPNSSKMETTITITENLIQTKLLGWHLMMTMISNITNQKLKLRGMLTSLPQLRVLQNQRRNHQATATPPTMLLSAFLQLRLPMSRR
jgi:hypothetical protein